MISPTPSSALLLLEYCDSLLQMHTGERLINKIFARAMQSHALGRVIIMHYEAQAGVGNRPTLTRLQNEIGYSRTLVSFFALLRVAKLVTVEADGDDRRIKYLVPSARVIDGLRQWLVRHLRCCEALHLVEPGMAERLEHDDALFALYIRHSRFILNNITQRFMQFPSINWFMEHDCGDRIALCLIREHFRHALAHGEHPDSPTWFRLGGSRIASDLGISKSHVRNVINEAEQRGLLMHDETRHAMALTAAFITEACEWFTNNFSFFAETALRALAELPELPAGAEFCAPHALLVAAGPTLA